VRRFDAPERRCHVGEPINRRITVRAEEKSEPELRKLARALLALAKLKLEQETEEDANDQVPGDAA
jgi:hypothetical protein